jgi:hypothetical protein
MVLYVANELRAGEFYSDELSWRGKLMQEFF